MSYKLADLKQKYWEYFLKLTQTPRASNNPEIIIPVLKREIEKLGYEPIIDSHNNIFFTILPSKGYEKNDSILLQAHSDMVYVKEKNFKHDAKKDPIKVEIDGDWLKSIGTSLGADDGIGVAYMLAIAADKTIKHPMLEMLITWNEEVSPQAITSFDVSKIKSKQMINLDNEMFDEVVVGCVGMKIYDMNSPVIREKNNNEKSIYTLSIDNLAGGHSGNTIAQLKINAIRSIMHILHLAINNFNVNLTIISSFAQFAYNVIPSNCKVTFSIESDHVQILKKIIEQETKLLSSVYRDEKEIKFLLVKDEKTKTLPLNKKFSNKLLSFFELLPQPIFLYNEHENMYELSINFASLIISDNFFSFLYSIRSVTDIGYSLISQKIDTLIKILELDSIIIDNKDGSCCWTPKKDNKILEKYKLAYANYEKDKPLSVKVCKGGLECGFVVSKNSSINAIAIGPDLLEVHSINERLHIPSTDKMYKILLDIISFSK